MLSKYKKGVVLKDHRKKALIHVAILDLIEKANIQEWAKNEKLLEEAKLLLEINEELSEELKQQQ